MTGRGAWSKPGMSLGWMRGGLDQMRWTETATRCTLHLISSGRADLAPVVRHTMATGRGPLAFLRAALSFRLTVASRDTVVMHCPQRCTAYAY